MNVEQTYFLQTVRFCCCSRSCYYDSACRSFRQLRNSMWKLVLRQMCPMAKSDPACIFPLQIIHKFLITKSCSAKSRAQRFPDWALTQITPGREFKSNNHNMNANKICVDQGELQTKAQSKACYLASVYGECLYAGYVVIPDELVPN